MDMIKKRAAMRGQSGFTLVELLVAVAILAILAGVAVFAVGSLTSDAGASACKTEKDTITTAISAARASSSTTDTPSDFLNGTLKYYNAPVVATAAEVTATPANAGKYKALRLSSTTTDVPTGTCGDVPFT